MPQPSDTDTENAAPTLDDLLWELDVTTARPEPQSIAQAPKERRSPKERPAPTERPAPRERRAPKTSKRGRFHRPELESRWERLAGNRIAQVIGGVVLVGGTATLVVLALT